MTHVARFGYGECGVCDAYVALRRDGTMRTHRAHPSVLADSPGANCYGSHAYPKAVEPSATPQERTFPRFKPLYGPGESGDGEDSTHG